MQATEVKNSATSRKGAPTPGWRTRWPLVATTTLAVVVGTALTIGISTGFAVEAPSAHTPAVKSTSDTAAESAAKSADSAARKKLAPLSLPAPTSEPLGDAETTTIAVDAAVASLVAANNEILQRADGGTAGLENVAAGFVWGELQAQATEREKLGYKQVGAATVVSTTVRALDLAASPPAAEIGVCIDSSKVDVIDTNGNSLSGLLYKPGTPTLNVYGAQYLDGHWKLVTHDIPDNAPCE